MTCKATEALHAECDKVDAKFDEVLKILKMVEDELDTFGRDVENLTGIQPNRSHACLTSIRRAINIIEDEGGE